MFKTNEDIIKEVAEELGLDPKAVSNAVRGYFSKFGVGSFLGKKERVGVYTVGVLDWTKATHHFTFRGIRNRKMRKYMRKYMRRKRVKKRSKKKGLKFLSLT